jgi:uncharacterized protein YbjT (DUF2867 family)
MFGRPELGETARASMSKATPQAVPAPPLPPRVLVIGATGFVGRYLHPALVAAGYQVRSGTRAVEAARALDAQREWVEADLDRPDTLEHALQGCDAVVHLVQGIRGDERDPTRGPQRARHLRDAAERARVRRIVYLGAMEPAERPCAHVASRLEAGRVLRAGPVPAVELRCAAILGAGGATWHIASDLAARLPAMLLPRWADHRTWPVAIDDVVLAVLAALQIPEADVDCYDVPGPEAVTHRHLFSRVAAQLGAHPPMWAVGLASQELSSRWIALTTRVRLPLARALVAAMQSDVNRTVQPIWNHVPGHRCQSVEDAATRALLDERVRRVPTQRAVRAMRALGNRHSVASLEEA